MYVFNRTMYDVKNGVIGVTVSSFSQIQIRSDFFIYLWKLLIPKLESHLLYASSFSSYHKLEEVQMEAILFIILASIICISNVTHLQSRLPPTLRVFLYFFQSLNPSDSIKKQYR